MKLGIITWFTGSNYGTNLQAIALQYYLRNQGYEVNIINYEVPPPNVKKEKKSFIKKLLYQPEKYAIKIAMKRYEPKIEKRNRKIFNAVCSNCIFTPQIKNTEELISVCNTFDLLICGSDQIWNPNWYDRFYFADYDGINTKCISYAPSMGVNTIPVEVIPKIAHSISRLKCISVREEKAADLLAPYVSQRPEVVVDPTLLLTKADWLKLFPEKKQESGNYVLAFFLNDEKDHLSATRKFAETHNCKLILIPYKGITYLQCADKRADAGLEDLFDLIRNAEYVLTDSFHITVFSIIHRKQFFTFQRFKENSFTSQNVRVTNLLKMADLLDRLIPYQSSKIRDFNSIDYNDHIERLNLEIEKSKRFLKKAIEYNVS